MIDWEPLLGNAVLYGLGLTLVLVVIMTVSFLLAPDMWVGDYPPEIQARYGKMSARAARLRPYVAIPFFLALLAFPFAALLDTSADVGRVPFFPAVVSTFVVVFVFNAIDLLVLDWLLFCTVQPRLMVLPGTEGMAAYRDYRFHFVGFLKGLGLCLGAAVVIAALWTAGQALLSG